MYYPGRVNRHRVRIDAVATANGIVIHWAICSEHNEICPSLLRQHGVDQMVKSKSMLTEECGLNEFLEEKGIGVVDTDLGERVVQLAGEPPSHIVLPCIHKKKEEIGEIFHEHLGTPAGNADPQFLTYAARLQFQENFLTRSGLTVGGPNSPWRRPEFVICNGRRNVMAVTRRMWMSPAWSWHRKADPAASSSGCIPAAADAQCHGPADHYLFQSFQTPAPRPGDACRTGG